MTRGLIALLLLASLLLTGVVGCRTKSAQYGETDAPDGASVSTITPEATASAEASAPVADDAGSDAGTGATSVDTAAIQKELAAIQKELDSMSMPGEADFDSIEGDIP